MNLEERQKEINQAAADKAYAEQNQAAIDGAFAQKQEDYSTKISPLDRANKINPLDRATETGPETSPGPETGPTMQEIESSEPFQVMDPLQDSDNELALMFEPTTPIEDNFEKDESIGGKSDNKVLVKAPTPVVPTQNSGFSTMDALLTLISILSIMGIVISALIIYTR